MDPQGVARVSHEPIDDASGRLELIEWLGAVHGAGRSAKIDLKEGGPVIGAVLAAVSHVGLNAEDVWFNAAIEVLGESGFRHVSTAYPRARRSCPLDALASYLLVAPPAWAIVDLLRSWGVDWLCFGCHPPGVGSLVPLMQERGWPVNIWDVAEADELEEALSFRPDAITADLGAIHLRTASRNG